MNEIANQTNVSSETLLSIFYMLCDDISSNTGNISELYSEYAILGNRTEVLENKTLVLNDSLLNLSNNYTNFTDWMTNWTEYFGAKVNGTSELWDEQYYEMEDKIDTIEDSIDDRFNNFEDMINESYVTKNEFRNVSIDLINRSSAIDPTLVLLGILGIIVAGGVFYFYSKKQSVPLSLGRERTLEELVTGPVSDKVIKGMAKGKHKLTSVKDLIEKEVDKKIGKLKKMVEKLDKKKR